MADMMIVLVLRNGQQRQRYAGQVVMALSSGRIADLIVNRSLGATTSRAGYERKICAEYTFEYPKR